LTHWSSRESFTDPVVASSFQSPGRAPSDCADALWANTIAATVITAADDDIPRCIIPHRGSEMSKKTECRILRALRWDCPSRLEAGSG
jgi:hypothetical protein